MGDYWAHWIPDYLGPAGVRFSLVDGWRTRSRSSGGYDGVYGVQVHHTASSKTPAQDMAYQYVNAATRPIGAMLLDRTGLVHVGCAGATNTSGAGAARWSSRGVIPKDSGNRYLIAIEAANNAMGERWPDPQCEAYVRLCAALVRGANAETPGPDLHAGDVHAHYEYAPDRKVDPRGPSRWADGALELWDMDAFRRDVAGLLTPPPPPPPPPSPPPGGDPGVLKAHGWYHVNAGDSPWRVAELVWGSGLLHPALSARNSGTWHAGQLIEIPDLPTIVLTVAAGDSPWAILARLFPGEDPRARLAAFEAFNGGAGRTLHPGDVVSVPVFWRPR
jgi:hypothetical protein